jgi:glyoxylase-like metal-dependent hydrolase (beta-lactamase superfamily II)
MVTQARHGARLQLHWRTVGAFQENCYLVVDAGTGRAVLVDPGDEAETLVAMVRESGAELEAIWLTHGHLDHVGAIAAVKRVWDVPVHMHPADVPVIARAGEIAAMYGLRGFEQPEAPERALADGERVRVGGVELVVHHVPGHAPGLVMFVGEGIALAGDLLFAGSIGRTDLPYADPAAMQRSLLRAAQLPDDTVVYPGHGPKTTIGREKATNPFLTGAARLIAR